MRSVAKVADKIRACCADFEAGHRDMGVRRVPKANMIGRWGMGQRTLRGVSGPPSATRRVFGFGKTPWSHGAAHRRVRVSPRTCHGRDRWRGQFQRSTGPHPKPEHHKQHSALKFSQSFFDPA